MKVKRGIEKERRGIILNLKTRITIPHRHCITGAHVGDVTIPEDSIVSSRGASIVAFQDPVIFQSFIYFIYIPRITYYPEYVPL